MNPIGLIAMLQIWRWWRALQSLQEVGYDLSGKTKAAISVLPIVLILAFASGHDKSSPPPRIAPPRIAYEWELLKLAPGQMFISPDGTLRRYDAAKLSSYAKEIAPHCIAHPNDKICLQ
jgi:hypothetical protein